MLIFPLLYFNYLCCQIIYEVYLKIFNQINLLFYDYLFDDIGQWQCIASKDVTDFYDSWYKIRFYNLGTIGRSLFPMTLVMRKRCQKVKGERGGLCLKSAWEMNKEWSVIRSRKEAADVKTFDHARLSVAIERCDVAGFTSNKCKMGQKLSRILKQITFLVFSPKFHHNWTNSLKWVLYYGLVGYFPHFTTKGKFNSLYRIPELWWKIILSSGTWFEPIGLRWLPKIRYQIFD